LIGYNVYRNGVVIAESVPVAEYSDPDLGNGTYSYFVTAVYTNGESGPSNTVEVQITGVGVENPGQENRLLVYPNPANDVLNVSATEEINSLRLFNVSGKVVYESVNQGLLTRISIRNLQNGFYLLQITTDSGVTTQKINIR